MKEKLAVRGEAILDGITGVVGLPSVVSPYDRDRYSRRHMQSDVERSWTLVGKYMNIAIQEFEAETVNAPIIREAKSES
ncbi:MAG: hypothetical protein OXN88_10365 [Chloroflexota bacterium]|nr:hypothetical protein [Chloroflexota bacterium]